VRAGGAVFRPHFLPNFQILCAFQNFTPVIPFLVDFLKNPAFEEARGGVSAV
jgi:hypothetical protein